MPRVRPRLRLLLALVGIAAGIAAVVLLATQIPARGGKRSHPRATTPRLPADQELDAALAASPAQPLDLEHTDVLVAMVCTFRRDRLEAYGHDRPTSPFLRRVAETGVLFEHAIVQSPWTRPSTGSLVTGLWAETLQLDDPGNRSFHNRALADEHVTLAEFMKAHGYRTVGASGNPNISSTFGFDQGFDAYHEPESLWRDSSGPAPSGADLNAQLLAELDATPADQRVYLQGFYVDTHAPRRPSTQALRRVRSPDVETPRNVVAYDASLFTLDAHLAELYLEVKKRRPNLLFVVIGDHGEGLRLPEHHGKGHGNHLFTSTIDVPSLWHHPALPEPGRRVQGLSMGVDLVPTILDLLGGDPEQGFDGDSQAPALRGEQAHASHSTAYSQTYFRRSDKTAVISQGYHLIRDRAEDGAEALFALDESLQTTDLSGNHPSIHQRLAEELDRWERELAQAAERSVGPVEGAPSSDMIEQLRTLGYIE
jgi:arylsulfatase A-like enzyme